MRLYEECLEALKELTEGYACRRLKTDAPWPDGGKNQLLFRSDTAFELGSGVLPAMSGLFITQRADSVPEDEVLLYGTDLDEMSGDGPYARIALVRIRQDAAQSEEKTYQLMRKLEYARYHINPHGFMLRISSLNCRESARIGREALKNGLNLGAVGHAFLEEYHKHPEVEAVKLIFITDPAFPYDRAAELIRWGEDITKTLDHLRQKVKMDCTVCGLKDICAEVEELCKEDFPQG